MLTLIKVYNKKIIKFIRMDVTLLYNGYNLQRKKMFIQSPRHNLNHQFQVSWPQSFNHDHLSPTSRLRNRQKQQTLGNSQQVHNTFVQSYLSKNLGIRTNSRIKRLTHIQRKRSDHSQSLNLTKTNTIDSHDRYDDFNGQFKLPSIGKTNEIKKRKSIVDNILGQKNNGYFGKLLEDRLSRFR